jgi:hypothetical protein
MGDPSTCVGMARGMFPAGNISTFAKNRGREGGVFGFGPDDDCRLQKKVLSREPLVSARPCRDPVSVVLAKQPVQWRGKEGGRRVQRGKAPCARWSASINDLRGGRPRR